MFCQSAPPPSAPDPRLTARSMLSLGTEVFFAFWMASYNVGLAYGSPPPLRAATSMFLISFAKSLPRLASTAAFLCLVVAHLEWPDMCVNPPVVLWCRAGTPGALGRGRPTHQVSEVLVHADVTRQLGVEGRGHEPPLTDRNDPTGVVARFR